MKLIGITGMPGSGKNAIFEIAKKHNIPIISMGDIVRHETKKKGLELNPTNVGNTAIGLREKYGNEAIAVPCIEYIKEQYNKNSNDFIIIEGIRSLYEVEYFKKFYDLIIVSIHSSPKTRFKRLISRNREDDTAEWDKFIERDYRELDFSIGKVIAMSDYVIINEGNYEDYLINLDKLIMSIINNKNPI
ncbi:AAA family ATPase [Methanococcus aeolicus]|uniref:UPF0200 protein Maeo_0813 n=1 Tax=Methanococcus aeolicus (strain ATCC BAA-1280 / DSM 17508 / OCM 812 / Nankai-3) TaxID=419665 RepID=A6UV74_META3|nr:AAA family ATPase [Methanococcus aeolicus]ABR56396.1 conserved hypothetical protein [Methanococcus aeolicus Nankai-3]UXM84394.1 AAA family ATPase [Methanococcus aeolicus]